MKKRIIILTASLLAFTLSNCNNMSKQNQRDTTTGALIGAAGGALIGNRSGNTAGGALIGAAAGGAAGAAYSKGR